MIEKIKNKNENKMKSIEWVATINTEYGKIKLGIQKNDAERFELVGKCVNGGIEKTGRIYDTYGKLIESIKLMYDVDPWFLEWIN